ncbi:NAD(P)/FAD-dependent oxidoreductase [Pseudonocardia acaciae]|uniref:NAD(P)/FAD-dependent oxidoreductase n=1 Tax=Pseudonocardia acaciae TaxID=551276 RepID=UPI00048C597E|nr:FAD-binding oxidoreductase [Pseudonocardia acaciae]
MKVIVVGAGILGASVARSLAMAGERVHLLDQWGPGTGTTATTFAWVNANRKLDPDYFRLNVAGMEEHAKLAHELGGPQAYFPTGSVHCADSRNESWLVSSVERLRSLDYPAHWVEREDAVRIAGDIRIPDSITAMAHFPNEGYVLPERLLSNLLADARRHGAEISVGEVVAVHDDPGGSRVVLAGGETRTADRVVLATGRWTDDLATRSGLDIPMMTDIRRGSPIVGLLGYVTSPRVDLRCVVHTPSLNLRPAAHGRTVVQALNLNSGVDPKAPLSADCEIARAIVQRFSRLMTERNPSPEIEPRVAIRSMPADGQTIAGYASERSRVYCLVTHSGITLAPLLGRLAAAEIVNDHTQDLLQAFRPTRFAGVRRSELNITRATRLGEQ